MNNKKNYSIETKGGNIMAVNDQVEVISSSNEELNGEQGTITSILSGDHGTEIKVLFDNGKEAWIDSEEVITF